MAKNLKDNTYLKRYIADFAYNEFKRKGVKAVKMDDLAAQLGISKRTIYELFEDKEDLLVEGLRMDFDKARRHINDILDEEGPFFEAFVKWLSTSVSEIQGINCNFLIDLSHYHKVQEYFNQQRAVRHQNTKALMERGINEGVFRNDIDYSILINIQDVIKREMIHLNVVNESNFSTYFKSVQMVMLRGVCTEKGLQILNKYVF